MDIDKTYKVNADGIPTAIEEVKEVLASKGRFGDEYIDIIDGKPEHTNILEHNLLDTASKNGQRKQAEALVKALGSQTINPETGLKENFDPVTALIFAGGAAIFGGLHQASQTGTTTWRGLWDYSLGRHGLGSLFGGGSEDALRQQARQSANEGFVSTKTSAMRQLGDPEKGEMGEISDKKADEITNIQSQTAVKSEEIARQTDNIVASSGFETGGPAAQLGFQNQMNMIKAGDVGIKGAVDEAEDTMFDVVTGLNATKNEILSGYMTTTGQEFGSSSQLADLEEYIDSFDMYNEEA